MMALVCATVLQLLAWFADFAPAEKVDEPLSGAPPATPPTPNPDRSLKATRLQAGQAIRLDGKLDDMAWNAAEPASGFRMWDPDRGADGYQSTVFKVAYDPDAVYFAIACAESDPQKITKKLARRDRPTDSDGVRVYIDPYHDRTTGYYFEVNPLGVQADGYIYEDGNEDPDWDAVWQAETFEDRDGWYAEMRIPLVVHPLPQGVVELGPQCLPRDPQQRGNGRVDRLGSRNGRLPVVSASSRV
jgi:hypothetical protein